MSTSIVCDIDGVICDLTGRLLQAFSERWPDTAIERPTAWFVRDAHPDLTEEQYAWWDDAYDNPYYYATALPAPYAKESLHGARLFGLPVHYRSSRPAHLAATTRTWLEEWGFLSPDSPGDAFRCGNGAKVASRSLDADCIVHIDDDVETLAALSRSWQSPGTGYVYLLIDQPYNRRREPPGGTRLASVRDLPLAFGELWDREQPARQTPIPLERNAPNDLR